MRTLLRSTLLTCTILLQHQPQAQTSDTAQLPTNIVANWNLQDAQRDITPTRERVCLNGLWQWQPGTPEDATPPASDWGWFKVPGPWPGITDYMQKDSQTLHPHPAWNNLRISDITTGWYQRTLTIPSNWDARQIDLQLNVLNSLATVFLDNQHCGEIQFPGGELNLTRFCTPGQTHQLSILVVALPLKGVLLSYSDSASARTVSGRVPRRGLCGDVYLTSSPQGPRIQDVKADPSVRQKNLTLTVSLEQLPHDQLFTLHTTLLPYHEPTVNFTSPTFSTSDLQSGKLQFSLPWIPQKLWDIHTPQHLCQLQMELRNAQQQTLDSSHPVTFGFRELWTENKNFILNGIPLHLAALPLDNAQVSTALATYDAARESLKRLQSFGINFVYTHNYDCLPGSHLAFDDILRAADDTGMLVALSQPHFSHYDWPSPEATQTNGYARHAAAYVRTAQHHPSVVAYAMSHNATGYNEDMNPLMIDGIQDQRDNWARRNVDKALQAEAIVRQLDPSRMVYHHASGNLGPLHIVNFYPNFVPIQELSDWFEHWSNHGVKPAFLCEYGAPFTWDWTLYRGWYRGQREFGSAQVPWEFCLAEWNAQFIGDPAYNTSEAEKTNLRWEAQQFRNRSLWHRWDYPHQVGSTTFNERYPVFAAYLTDNFRAFRTWGLSALSPWEHGHFWQLSRGTDRQRVDLPTRWNQLQHPGYSPDYQDQRYERFDLAYSTTNWIATPAAQALYRNIRPLLAYIAGKPDRFTSKDHNFLPGETISKQLVIINDSREPVSCTAHWTLNLPQPVRNETTTTIAPGQQTRIPIQFSLPPNLQPNTCTLDASFTFSTGEIQNDSFTIHILPPPRTPKAILPIALFDPQGETSQLLANLNIPTQPVTANTDLSPYPILIIGKGALTTNLPAPNITSVRNGLKVLVFEQTTPALESRLGFRTTEYGLRTVFPRTPDHPALSQIKPEHLRDWRGSSTLLPPTLEYTLNPKFNGAPTVQWCNLPVTRLWRCGNQGNVASALIEKPARGNFLPILDGGFSLQYSPLLEYHEGQGMILFCQLDVTSRTEPDPAAQTLVANLINHIQQWTPAKHRRTVYYGGDNGRQHLVDIGIEPAELNPLTLTPNDLLVVAPDTNPLPETVAATISLHLQHHAPVLAIGWTSETLPSTFPLPLAFEPREHISAAFTPPLTHSPFAGISPADLHNRDPRTLQLLTSSPALEILANGALATAINTPLTLCQLTPWEFNQPDQMNLKRTHRRLSFMFSRLLANLGSPSSTPLLERFHQPVTTTDSRWLTGLYLDTPEEWDDPYRFFRW
ncbi:MAG: hypothetical protein RI897_2129 [Verrucomicrobiota bacterium]|jgi:hypothetical protein